MSGNEREDRLVREVQGAIAGCPSADDLQAFDAGELEGAARAAVEAHVATCSACRAGLAALKEMGTALPDASTGETELPADVEHRSEELIDAMVSDAVTGERPLWDKALPLVASLFLVAFVGSMTYLFLGTDRFDGDLGELRGTEDLQLLQPSGSLAAPPSRMEWTAYPGAAAYRVFLFDAAMNVLWEQETETSQTFLDLDVAATAVMPPGARLTWQVHALGAMYEPLGQSGSGHFEIARE